MSDSSCGSEWELVTGTFSSQTFSACSSADVAADGGTVDSNVGSGYFRCTPTYTSHPPDSLSSGGTEQFSMIKSIGVTPPALREDVTYAVEDIPSEQVEEIVFSRGILMSEGCIELSKLDWMEPRSPGHQLLEYECSGLGNTSNPDAHAPEIKDGLEPNSQQVGPLLGSCVSAPFSSSIVCRDNSVRLILTDEMVGEVLWGNATSQRGCQIEVEPDTLASVQHEMLLVHSAFIYPHSLAVDTAMHKMGVTLEESSTSALGHERASEIWWNKQAALRGVHGRQASTYWSIALAAAMMGLIILGHVWQYERRQYQQLQLRLCLEEEKIDQLILQIANMKEVLSGRRRVPVLRPNSYFNGSFQRY